MANLLIVARDDLPLDERGRLPQALVHQLGRLSRRGIRLLVLAMQPEQWRPTRGTLDNALSIQQQFSQQLESSGIHLDGVIYVSPNHAGQQQSVNLALEDVKERYGSVESTILLSSDTKDRDRVDNSLAQVVLLAANEAKLPGGPLAGALERIMADLDKEPAGQAGP